MVQAEEPGGGRPKRGSSRAAAAVTLMAACLLVAAVALVGTFQGPVELDREADELAKLQREKATLEAQLTSGLSTHARSGAHKGALAHLAGSLSHFAAKAQAKKVLSVKGLEAKKRELEARLSKFEKDSKKDPVVAGVLGKFKTDAGDGLLGKVKESHEDILGSLGSLSRVRAEHKMLMNEARAMGDVSPKEALAQRVIALGKQFLRHGAHPVHKVALTSGAEAVARVAAKHSALAAHARAPTLAARLGAPPAVQIRGLAQAEKRVEVLKRELSEATRVEKIEESLEKAKGALLHTQAEAARLKGGRGRTARRPVLTAHLDESGNDKFDAAREAVEKYMGASRPEAVQTPAEESDDDEDDCRFTGGCHSKGYVGGAIYVGTADNTGPDRYAQLGAGPQLMQGKVGDNVIGVGPLGAAGGDDDDVMVPVRMSGARKRDRLPGRLDPEGARGFPTLSDELRNRVVAGSAMHEGGEKTGIADEEVPISAVHASMFRAARTQDLAQH